MTVYQLQKRTLERVGDDPTLDPSLMHYTPNEVLVVLNQVQRLFCLFTLVLESTKAFALTNTAFYHMLDSTADWIAPLRIRNAAGTKLRPSRLADLAALDTSWKTQTGAPSRYVHSGFDLLGFYKHNSETVSITYARSPVPLVSTWPADNAVTPEIPARFHPAMIDGAEPLLRAKEGMQEWQKVVPLWNRFIEEVSACAALVRARNREQGYDVMPGEIKRMDGSRVLQKAG